MWKSIIWTILKNDSIIHHLPACSRNAKPTHLPAHDSTGMWCHVDFRGPALAWGTSCSAYFHRFRVRSKLEKRKGLSNDILGYAIRRKSVISVAGNAWYYVWQSSIYSDSWISFLISLLKLFTDPEEMSRVWLCNVRFGWHTVSMGELYFYLKEPEFFLMNVYSNK